MRPLNKGDELSALVSRMRGGDPDKRPSMRDVYESLTRLYTDLSEK